MLGTVKRRAQYFRHPGIELKEVITLSTRADNILNGCEDGAGIRYEIGSGFDFEVNFASGFVGEGDKCIADRCSNILKFSSDFA